MDIPHFVYPLIADGHLGCCRSLAIMSFAALNVHIQVFSCGNIVSVLMGIYLRAGFLGHI